MPGGSGIQDMEGQHRFFRAAEEEHGALDRGRNRGGKYDGVPEGRTLRGNRAPMFAYRREIQQFRVSTVRTGVLPAGEMGVDRI